MANKINSRTKGNRFERAMAKWFTEWTGYEFGRVPGSGSLRWKKTDSITGDITCTDDKHARRFLFSVECKSYQEIRFEHLLLNKKSCKINNFWAQAFNDAERAGKLPILIMKYNSMPKGEAFLVVNPQVGKIILDQFNFDGLYYFQVYSAGLQAYIFLASQIKNIDYLTFHKACKSLKKS